MKKNRLNPQRILVKESEKNVLNLFKSVSGLSIYPFDKGSRFDVKLCTQGDEALEAVKLSIKQGRAFSMAFIDVIRPNASNGFQIAEQISNLDPLLEVVLMTDKNPDAKPLEKARMTHAVDKIFCTPKPCSIVEVQQLVIMLSTKWQMEKRLIEAQRRLNSANRDSGEIKEALCLLMEKIEKEQEKVQQNIAFEIHSNILPIIKKLRMKMNCDMDRVEMDILESHIKDLVLDFTKGEKISTALTPAELRIACMIKNGLPTHKIADQLYISSNTVKTHRKNIRKKLGLSNAAVNLQAFLNQKNEKTTGMTALKQERSDFYGWKKTH